VVRDASATKRPGGRLSRDDPREGIGLGDLLVEEHIKSAHEGPQFSWCEQVRARCGTATVLQLTFREGLIDDYSARSDSVEQSRDACTIEILRHDDQIEARCRQRNRRQIRADDGHVVSRRPGGCAEV
jgi:hypothetical protein